MTVIGRRLDQPHCEVLPFPLPVVIRNESTGCGKASIWGHIQTQWTLRQTKCRADSRNKTMLTLHQVVLPRANHFIIMSAPVLFGCQQHIVLLLRQTLYPTAAVWKKKFQQKPAESKFAFHHFTSFRLFSLYADISNLVPTPSYRFGKKTAVKLSQQNLLWFWLVWD